eukprot:bmy_01363T0
MLMHPLFQDWQLFVSELSEPFAQIVSLCSLPSDSFTRQALWKLLTAVQFGETVSYQQLAALAGNPKAARAVGGAMRSNPVSLRPRGVSMAVVVLRRSLHVAKPCELGPGSIVVRGLALDPERPRWPGAQTDGGCLAVFQIPILIPCHRVVCSSGALGGYSGGVAVKEWLLAHEGGPAGKLACGGGSRPARAWHGALGGTTSAQPAGQD